MNTHDLSAPTSDGDGHGAGDEGVEAGSLSAGVKDPTRPMAVTSATNSPSPAPPLTAEEYDAIVGAIWADLDEDPTRIGDLLADALGLIGSLALRPELGGPLMPWLAVQARAVELLRAMEQRALWGPNQSNAGWLDCHGEGHEYEAEVRDCRTCRDQEEHR